MHRAAFWWMSFDFLEEAVVSLPLAPVLALVKTMSDRFILIFSFFFFQQKSLFPCILFWLKSDENQRGSGLRSTTGFVTWNTSRTESADQRLGIPTKLGAQAGLAEKHGKAGGAQQSSRQVPQAGCPTLLILSPLTRTFASHPLFLNTLKTCSKNATRVSAVKCC